MKPRQRYERPSIQRQVDGLMNKVGRPAPARPFDRIDGAAVDDLVRDFGSPLFVFSERQIRQRYREAVQAFTVRYPRVQFAWSYKTNYLDAVCSIYHQEGSWAEVVSEMEYEKARRLGMPGAKIIYNGPCKTRASLDRAIAEGALLQVDHLEEVAEIEELAAAQKKKARVGVRINLDSGLQPAWDRFGFNLESGGAFQAVKRIVAGGRCDVTGLHCHIGTFLLDPTFYRRAIEKILAFAATIRSELGVRIETVNMGGGFASTNTLYTQYLPGDQACPSFAQYAEALTGPLMALSGKEMPTLILETGRGLVDDTGVMVASVIGTKRLTSGLRAVIVDAGLNVLITALWYKLQVYPAQPFEGISEDTVVYGPLCMRIDCLREAVTLPDLKKGDKVVIKPVGAYCVSQSWQFIKLRPAVVLVDMNGKGELIRRAETLDDLVGPEILPERLKIKA